MKKLSGFVTTFIILLLFLFVSSLFYHIMLDKVDRIYLLSIVLKDVLLFIPVISALALFWGLVFRSREEMDGMMSKSAVTLSVVVYIFITIGLSMILYEVLNDRINSRMTQKIQPKTAKNFTLTITDSGMTQKDLVLMKILPVKENISFGYESSYLYFRSMYQAKNGYIIHGLSMINLDRKDQIGFTIYSEYAKIIDDEILCFNPYYTQYTNARKIVAKQISGIKKIPLNMSSDGIYHLKTPRDSQAISLLKIFQNYDFIYNSKVNFYHIGNLVYNRLCYYLIFIFLLLIMTFFGTKYKNIKLFQKEYLQTVCFFIASCLFCVVAYDLLVSFANMIYGLII